MSERELPICGTWWCSQGIKPFAAKYSGRQGRHPDSDTGFSSILFPRSYHLNSNLSDKPLETAISTCSCRRVKMPSFQCVGINFTLAALQVTIRPELEGKRKQTQMEGFLEGLIPWTYCGHKWTAVYPPDIWPEPWWFTPEGSHTSSALLVVCLNWSRTSVILSPLQVSSSWRVQSQLLLP